MAKLFNKIRMKLVSEKPSTTRTTNYLKYAIGEIVLVVFGILIALSINNWNGKRIASIKEKVLLKQLHKEFIDNKYQLDTVIYYHQRAFESTLKIIAQFPIDTATVNLDSLGKNLYYSTWNYTFNPKQGIINSIVNTSSFEIISNTTLRNLIATWNDIVADFQEEELNAVVFSKDIFEPFVINHFEWGFNLRYKGTNLNTLTTLEFENIIKARKGDLKEILSNDSHELENVQNSINQIIELTNIE